MPRNFLQKCFTRWIDKNADRFNYPPCNIHYKNGAIQFNLEGIILELEWYLSNRNSVLHINYKDYPCWDVIGCCEVEEKKTINELYYCGYCAGSDSELKPGRKVMLYLTRKELWDNECFENLLISSNCCTEPKLWLGIFGHENGSTRARLYPEYEVEELKTENDFVEALPIHIEQS